MSCNTRRRAMIKALLGDVSGADLTALEAQFMAQCGPIDPDEIPAYYLQKTHAIMLLCDRFGLPRPVHSRSGIPKPRTHRAYAWLFDELARRGVFAPPVAEDAPLVPADQVPVGALIQYECGCSGLRIKTPDGSREQAWMLRLHTRPDCDDERPVGAIEWVDWSEALRVVSPPPFQPQPGIVAEVIEPGRYPAIEQELEAARQAATRLSKMTELGKLALNHPHAIADSSIRRSILGEVLVHAGWKPGTGVVDLRPVDSLITIAIDLDLRGFTSDADQIVEYIGRRSDRAGALVDRACEQPEDKREPLFAAAIRLIAADAPTRIDTTVHGCVLQLKEIGDVSTAARMIGLMYEPHRQAEVIIFAARWFPPDESNTLMTLARSVGTGEDFGSAHWNACRALALAALVDRQPIADRSVLVDEILDLTATNSMAHWRHRALTLVADHLTVDQAHRAKHILDMIELDDAFIRGSAVDAYAAVIPRLDPVEQSVLQEQMLRLVLDQPVTANGVAYRTEALLKVTPRLTGNNRATAVKALFATVPQLPRSWSQAEAIIKVAPHLTSAERAQAHVLAEAIRDEQEQERAMAALSALKM